jgi:hypothetical protein
VPNSQSAEQTTRSAEKFFVWLKRKYPVAGVDINIKFVPAPYLRAKGVFATIWSLPGRACRIEISVGRPTNEVLRSVAHEWRHVLQMYNEGIPVEKIKMKQEIAAVGFAGMAVGRYSKQVGDDW